MMRLSTMQAVVATVDKQWESHLVDEIVRYWEHDAGRPKYWRASANFVFFFKKAGRDHVLRFNRATERIAQAIEAEIDFVNALADMGLRVARPVRSKAGYYVERTPTSQGMFYAAVFEALPGEQLELEELTPDQFARWGQTLGEFHNAATQYTQPGRPTWQNHLAWVDETLPFGETIVQQALERLREELSQLPKNQQNFGLIHYDFELDNLIWDGEQFGIIDFDDSAWYWFVADIALALSDLFGDCASKVDFQNKSYLRFIEGYRRVRQIEQAELDRIPLFMQLDHVIGYARLYRALTPVNLNGELPWMEGLRHKLTAKMQFYRDELAR